MQTIKQWKYCWHLDFIIIFGLLIVKIYVSFLNKIHFEWKNDKVLTFNLVHFPNFEISASLYLAPLFNKCRT